MLRIHRLLILLCTCLVTTHPGMAQELLPRQDAGRYLALDKPGQVKRIRFYVGDRLTFKLKGDKTKYRAEITHILPGAVAFGDAIVPVSEFKNIYYTKNSYWAQMAHNASDNAKVAGLAFAGLGAVGTAAAPDNRNVRSMLWGGLSVFGTSQLLKIFYLRNYRLNNYRRLHIIEAPYAEVPQQ